MKNIYFLITLFSSLAINGQDGHHVSDYIWDEDPKFGLDGYSEDAMMALKEKYVVEFSFEHDNAFTEHYLEHKAFWLNSNDKIEEYNKIYLPYTSDSELIVNKARVITKDGRIINLDDSKILTAQDEETGKAYKYFAFEGVEKGSIIEYYYIEKTKPSYNGTTFRLQSDFVKRNVEFDLYAPPNLVFEFKSYNGIPEITKDTLSKDRLHWKLHIDTVQSLPKEEQAPYSALRGFLVYKLDKNLKTNEVDISSYNKVSQNIYNYYYPEPNKKAKGLIHSFTKDIAEKDSLEVKIRKIDNLIKSSFNVAEGADESLKDLEQILEKKVGSTTGLIKLYVALLRHLGIIHEIVITSDRNILLFDSEFEAHNFLSEFLIYFPELKKYLSPTDMESRYGFPSPDLMDNYGLFIKEVSLGGNKSGIGRIKYIEPLGAEMTVDKMVIDVRFDQQDMTTNFIKLDRSLSGYNALPIHPYMGMIVGDNKVEMVEGLAKTINENIIVEKMEVVNEDPKLFGIKPLEFLIEFKSESFVEKAGNKYLFKIGELIGRQIEMYQEKERNLPLVDNNKRSYYRTINVELPNGYKVANLDHINIENVYMKNGKELLSFKSYYEINDRVLKITADEHYHLNVIEPNIIQEYRKVINSAADFNKITLILEPQS